MTSGPRLSDSVTSLPGVGAKRAECLARLGIETVEDLLRHAPRAYEERGEPVAANELAQRAGSFAVVRGVVRSSRVIRGRRSRTTLRATLEDSTGVVEALWFNAAFLAREVATGRAMAWAGRVSADGVLIQPELARCEPGDAVPARLTGIRPAYPLTDGVSQRLLFDLVDHALELASGLSDSLSDAARDLAGVVPLKDAVRFAHRPSTPEEADLGRARLLFDELLPLELEVRRRLRDRKSRNAPSADGTGGGAAAFVTTLPFELSPSQADAVADIRVDLAGGHPMGRMLVGEVGSGKTVVALAAIQEARSRGMQCALLAPTDLLARQHYRTAQEMLPDGASGVVLLTGTMSTAAAREARERLASGHADVAIGTHALFSEATVFRRLGLAVIDEQHRFGVAQREALLKKASTPHCLVLTATPIPRTLALLAFGDVELSVLERREGARGEVTTRLVPRRKRRAALEWLRGRLQAGEQAFLVRPRIEGKDGAVEFDQELRSGPLRDLPIGMIHGRLAPDQRDAELERFRRGELVGLVCTTLVEVGLDIPGASILWVEGADRLGLAQIHQLRGRIARRGQKGYCWLVEDEAANADAAERLRVLVDVEDGFRLAEIDLATRGPGELLGLKQSGRLGAFAGWHGSAPARLADLVDKAARVAELLLEGDPCTV